jgi:hypothetical protein
VIRADPDLLAGLAADPTTDLGASGAAPVRKRARAKPSTAKAPERQALPPPPIPAWARASGRAGEGDPLFAAGAALALLDGHLRTDPPAAGAVRVRLALMSAAASAKMLRVNTDEGALRDLRFAVGDPLGPAANLLSLWRDLAGRPPSLDPDRIGDAAARLDLGLANTTALTESLLAHSRVGIRFQPPPRPPPPCSPTSRTLQWPYPKSWRSGCSTWSSPSGSAGPDRYR